MDPIFWVALILFLAVVLGAAWWARRSESYNEYLDETEDRQAKTPPASTGYFGP